MAVRAPVVLAAVRLPIVQSEHLAVGRDYARNHAKAAEDQGPYVEKL